MLSNDRNSRGIAKYREGVVSSDSMDKTIVVTVKTKTKHKMYGKYMTKTSKYLVHDKDNQCGVGDIVKITECRPLSKLKRWRLQEVVVKAV